MKPLTIKDLKPGTTYQIAITKYFWDEMSHVEHARGEMFEAEFVRESKHCDKCALFKIGDKIEWLPEPFVRFYEIK